MNKFEKRAARGAAWLDRQKPNWVNHVNLTRLDLSDDQACVMGQVFAEESRTEARLPWDRRTGTAYVVRVLHPAWSKKTPFVWAFRRGFISISKLQEEAWHDLVNARRAKQIIERGGLTEEAEQRLLALSA